MDSSSNSSLPSSSSSTSSSTSVNPPNPPITAQPHDTLSTSADGVNEESITIQAPTTPETSTTPLPTFQSRSRSNSKSRSMTMPRPRTTSTSSSATVSGLRDNHTTTSAADMSKEREKEGVHGAANTGSENGAGSSGPNTSAIANAESDTQKQKQKQQPSRRSTLTSLFRRSRGGNVEGEGINYQEYITQGHGLESIASVNRDGRISLVFEFKDAGDANRVDDDANADVNVNGADEDKMSVKTRGSARTSIKDLDIDTFTVRGHDEVEEFGVDKVEWRESPRMSVVVMIVGSRGDVQPYLALGQQLLKDGHRVRIATHETFRAFVTDAGLEFFSIGGNPQDLMSYMVKNPGLIPGIESLANGDIKRKRKMLAEMIDGCWRACHSPDPKTGQTFAADAIISNPPAFAHVHCAEALGIPLLLSFTMPWTPTASFAHPLVNITSNAGFGLSNYLSYAAADLLTWQGVGDIINTFRTSVLGLEPLTITTGPGFVDRARVPWTYCMSPALVPKPEDWKSHIDVVGFYFLDLASTYEPPPELVKFLNEGPPPVYIGFGSVVVDNPAAMTKIIFDATQQAGVRALVSAGWGGLGGTTIPLHIHILGNVPHDWLFANERVCAVVHHGGAGTTAIGLAKGRPTVVVPFFGDQGFWGNMIHKSGAGPRPIPHRDLTVKRLREAIKFALLPTTKEAAAKLAQSIHDELLSKDGVRRGVDSFYKHLPLLNMRCDLEPTKLAVWWSAEHYLKLSAFAAQVLIDAGLIKGRSLVLHRPKEYHPSDVSTIASTDEAHGLFWSVTHPTGLTEVFQGKPKRERSVSPNPSHGLFNALASLHEGFHDPLSPRQIPRGLDPVSDSSSDESSDNELRSSKSKATTAVTTTPATATVIQPAPRAAKHRHSSSLTDTIFNALVDSAECASENLLGMAKQSTVIFNSVNNVISPKRSSQSEKDRRPSAFSRWKAIQASTGRPQEREIRAIRIACGKEAAKQSTKSQRAHVIKRFHEEVTQTSARRKRFAESIKQAMMGGIGAEEELKDEGATDVVISVPMTASPLGSPISEGHPLDRMVGASYSEPTSRAPSFPTPTFGPIAMMPSTSVMSTHPLSPFVTQPLDGEDDDAVFIREMETALRLSLAHVEPTST
ncbi:hypothetical protein CVT24_000617 [Panaeolus cyanescens]|uniref:Uncharacterized protein n=1 Tax=Panaeolus cyanescens TaxID=181874 RepID=A0A409YT73_9AGAR|nr:hypothetical protein CVT24_000617 [Panaeolus cyanescens]